MFSTRHNIHTFYYSTELCRNVSLFMWEQMLITAPFGRTALSFHSTVAKSEAIEQ